MSAKSVLMRPGARIPSLDLPYYATKIEAKNPSLYSSYYAEACNEFTVPNSVS